MTTDKKTKRDKINFVVVDDIGACSQRAMTVSEICAAL